MRTKLSLLVPGLCGPLPGVDTIEAAAGPLLKVLTSLDKHAASGTDFAGQLSDLFGLKMHGPFPYAALALLAHDHPPGDHCWIHADPVNLQADMDRAILSDSQQLHIRPDEAGQLVAELNAHFAEDGIELLMADENNWFIRLDACDLETTALHNSVGRNINQLLPGGEAAASWRRLLNESQMLMHISEVNQRREQQGQASINSLWLWGEGVLPQTGDTDITRVYANDAVATGIAKLNKVRHSTLSDPLELAQAMQQQGHVLASLNQLEGACHYGDTAAWLEDMLELVADWIEPLLAAAKSLDADVNIYPCNGVRYHLGHNNKFNIKKLMLWKKDRLQDHVDTQ